MASNSVSLHFPFTFTFLKRLHYRNRYYKKKKTNKRVYLIQKHAPQNCVHIHVKVSMALVQLKPRLWIWRVHFCILTQVPNWRKGEVEQVTWELVAAYWETSQTVLIKLLWFWTSCCSPFFKSTTWAELAYLRSLKNDLSKETHWLVLYKSVQARSNGAGLHECVWCLCKYAWMFQLFNAASPSGSYSHCINTLLWIYCITILKKCCSDRFIIIIIIITLL